MKDRKIKIEKVTREINKQNVNKTIDLQNYHGFVDKDGDVQIPLSFEKQVV